VARAARRLRGTDVSVLGPHGPSVTATAQVLMAATLAQGTTVIRDAAREPEIADLCQLLGRMGARIAATDSSTLVVDGVECLHGASHRVMPDRIEAGTWLLAGAITGGRVTVENAVPEHSTRLIELLTDVGATIRSGTDWLSVSLSERPRAFHITAEPYPGFPTDLQPQLAALASVAKGTSYVYDRVFPERFAYAVPLRRFGVAMEHHGQGIRVRGTSRLRGARARACDLRCGAALLLAALAAGGPSTLRGVAHLRRGYESLEFKLRQLGVEALQSALEKPASQAH
jgi:UDP-N-acetylglucosamine 1-carboxyvinyltransferase